MTQNVAIRRAMRCLRLCAIGLGFCLGGRRGLFRSRAPGFTQQLLIWRLSKCAINIVVNVRVVQMPARSSPSARRRGAGWSAVVLPGEQATAPCRSLQFSSPGCIRSWRGSILGDWAIFFGWTQSPPLRGPGVDHGCVRRGGSERGEAAGSKTGVDLCYHLQGAWMAEGGIGKRHSVAREMFWTRLR